MTGLPLRRLLQVLAAITLAGVVVEVSIRPASGILVTPLVASVLALALAYRILLRHEASHALQQQQLQQGSELHLATIEALVLAIGARDRSPQSQLRREQAYAGALARAFGLPDAEVEGVRTAALLHDIGNLAVPDHILAKRGPLSDEERSKVRVHTKVGSDIIADVPFPYPVASLVGSHHERWDGTGYPAGLRGSEIPLGARILAVVDYFAAITSDRAFGEAMPADEAVDLLWREAGKALDPAVVARFVELLPTLPQDFGTLPALPHARATAAPDTGAPSAAPRSQGEALDDIAMANQELRALYYIAQTMGTSLGVSDSMKGIASRLGQVIPFSACALFLYDRADRVARCRFATGIGADAIRAVALRVDEGLVGRVIGQNTCITNGRPDLDFAPTAARLATEGLQSALVCPLGHGGSVMGALAFYHTAADYFTEDHRRLALRMLDQTAAVIANSLVFERTQEESLTDVLTGLPNTRFLFPHLSRELARASRRNSPMSVLLLDLDNLKHINDTFGHGVGDRALCAVASVLRSAVRPYDICVRYGGDEFIVLLSECGGDQAEAKRLELQRAVDALPFTARERQSARLSISIGAAVYPQDGDTYDALLGVADSRMYRDKAERKRGQQRLSSVDQTS